MRAEPCPLLEKIRCLKMGKKIEIMEYNLQAVKVRHFFGVRKFFKPESGDILLLECLA